MEPLRDRHRVLVVDDSVVARRMVARVIDESPDLTVAATAANGRIGLAKLGLREFDAVVLDVEMPELDGLATLVEIRKSHPRIPVIMFSSLTRRGAETTLDALSLGANDYVTKPTAGAEGDGLEHIRRELIPRIRGLCTPRDSGTAPSRPPRLEPDQTFRPSSPAKEPRGPALALAIGVSTGGPNALQAIVPRFPATLAVPVFVVQHMPPLFTHLLAERLDAAGAISVAEARDGVEPRPGVVYLAPGDHHLLVRSHGGRAVLSLNRDERENSCRPAVDVLFRSLAAVYGPRVCVAILTGMGRDGLEGARTIARAGGRVFAQDEASSVVWGMPGLVVREGLAEAALGPVDIARALNEAATPRSGAACGAQVPP